MFFFVTKVRSNALVSVFLVGGKDRTDGGADSLDDFVSYCMHFIMIATVKTCC